MFKISHYIQYVVYCCCLLLLLCTQRALAERNIQQHYEQSIWSVESDPFYCKLAQTLDGYARLSVESKPSSEQTLIFKWLLTERSITDVQIYARQADWQRSDSISPDINFFTTNIDQQEIHFNTGIASVLRAIKEGFWLDVIVGFGDEQLKLTFTTTFSNNVIAEYQACRKQLAPLSWQNARDNEISFASGERTVKKPADLKLLEDLVRYIALDKKVTKVMVDGHTDNVGSALANRLLSKERADDVASRLVEFGLAEKMIEVRAHGQRYPKSNNKSQAGQSSNRRVLIRLFRGSN